MAKQGILHEIVEKLIVEVIMVVEIVIEAEIVIVIVDETMVIITDVAVVAQDQDQDKHM